jgi:hypothetical protein
MFSVFAATRSCSGAAQRIVDIRVVEIAASSVFSARSTLTNRDLELLEKLILIYRLSLVVRICSPFKQLHGGDMFVGGDNKPQKESYENQKFHFVEPVIKVLILSFTTPQTLVPSFPQ